MYIEVHRKGQGSMLKACIKKGNLQDLGEKDYVAPCNLFLETLFPQVDVYLQQKLVSSGAAGHA